MIVKSRIAASLPPLTNTELLAHVSTWEEIALGEIPEIYLETAYVRAMRDKDSGFALTASDLVQGYRANCESERALPQIPQSNNLLTGEVCQRCFGTGMEQFRESGYANMRRCDHVPLVTDEDADVDSW